MTVITLTRAEVAALKPCSLDKLKVFEGRDRLNAREALEAGASIRDLLWVAGKLGLKRQCVQFAVACAERVAHLNPDPRVQAALDAARAWLDDPSEDKRCAADAALAAAYAVRAAADAVRAAASDYASVYAVYAANAADYAAFPTGAAARAAQRDIFLTIFCPEDGQ